MDTPRLLLLANRVLRVGQLVACGIALAGTASSFGVTHSDDGFAYQLGSGASSLHLLAAYTCLLYALWFVAGVELCALAPRPRVPMMRLLDGLHAIVLVAASIVFAKSDYVNHCDHYGIMLTCHGFRRAVRAALVAAALFVVSIAITFAKPPKRPSQRETTSAGYFVETTPSAGKLVVASPLEDAATPSAKV